MEISLHWLDLIHALALNYYKFLLLEGREGDGGGVEIVISSLPSGKKVKIGEERKKKRRRKRKRKRVFSSGQKKSIKPTNLSVVCPS